MNFIKNNKLSYGLAAVSLASSTDSNSSILDMSGFEGVVAFVTLTDVVDTGVATLNVQQSDANSDTAMATITGATDTLTSAANDDVNGKVLAVDVYKPLKRYVQANIVSATANIAFGETYLVQYKASKGPITASATVPGATFVVGS